MLKPSLRTLAVSGFAAGMIACGGAAAPAQEPSQMPGSAAAPTPSSNTDEAARPVLTAEACEASGGAVQGDIGDGAIHRPEYRCPNGAKPSGSIGAPQGGPIAVEGAVCCPR